MGKVTSVVLNLFVQNQPQVVVAVFPFFGESGRAISDLEPNLPTIRGNSHSLNERGYFVVFGFVDVVLDSLDSHTVTHQNVNLLMRLLAIFELLVDKRLQNRVYSVHCLPHCLWVFGFLDLAAVQNALKTDFLVADEFLDDFWILEEAEIVREVFWLEPMSLKELRDHWLDEDGLDDFSDFEVSEDFKRSLEAPNERRRQNEDSRSATDHFLFNQGLDLFSDELPSLCSHFSSFFGQRGVYFVQNPFLFFLQVSLVASFSMTHQENTHWKRLNELKQMMIN